MGRETKCTCRWGEASGEVHAALEARELIVRGALKRRAPFADISDVNVRGDTLSCDVAGERVELDLGSTRAKTWARTIASPDTPLATKLGIDADTKLFVSGRIDDDALARAIAESNTPKAGLADARMAIARLDDVQALGQFVERIAPATNITAIWIVYSKGKNAPLGETAVRGFMRAAHFTDTKVASVSEKLTALHFSNAPPKIVSARPKHRSLLATKKKAPLERDGALET